MHIRSIVTRAKNFSVAFEQVVILPRRLFAVIPVWLHSLNLRIPTKGVANLMDLDLQLLRLIRSLAFVLWIIGANGNTGPLKPLQNFDFEHANHDQHRALNTILALAKSLNSAGAEWWLDAGTLLSWYRDGGPQPFLLDTDVGTLSSSDTNSAYLSVILPAMEGEGFTYSVLGDFFQSDPLEVTFIPVDENLHTKANLVFYTSEPDGSIWRAVTSQGKQYQCRRMWPRGVRPVQFEEIDGEPLYSPRNLVGYLTTLYGLDWSHSNLPKQSDWSVNSPCTFQAVVPINSRWTLTRNFLVKDLLPSSEVYRETNKRTPTPHLSGLHLYVLAVDDRRGFYRKNGIPSNLQATLHFVYAANDPGSSSALDNDIVLNFKVTYETLRRKSFAAIQHFATFCKDGMVFAKTDEDVWVNWAGLERMFTPPSNALLLASEQVVGAGDFRGFYHYLKVKFEKNKDNNVPNLMGSSYIGHYNWGPIYFMSCRAAKHVARVGILPLLLEDHAIATALHLVEDRVWVNLHSKILSLRDLNNCYDPNWIALHFAEKYELSVSKRQHCWHAGTNFTELPVVYGHPQESDKFFMVLDPYDRELRRSFYFEVSFVLVLLLSVVLIYSQQSCLDGHRKTGRLRL